MHPMIVKRRQSDDDTTDVFCIRGAMVTCRWWVLVCCGEDRRRTVGHDLGSLSLCCPFYSIFTVERGQSASFSGCSVLST